MRSRASPSVTRSALPPLPALAALLALVACTSTASSPIGTPSPPRTPPTSPAPSSSPSLPAVSVRLDPPPSVCPGPSPRPREVTAAYGKLIGGGPLWAGFYAELDAEANAFHAADAPRTELGWRIKVLWVMRPGQTEPVTVEAVEAATGERLWFEVEGETPTPTPRLDPAHPGVPPEPGHWREFPSYLYFPRAACYRLAARWPDGSWDFGFGFGR